MEKTLTARDKALLLILGIIVIIFAGVMIPAIGGKPIGIYSQITASQDVKKKIVTQENENEEMFTNLVASGLDPRFVENAIGARKSLQSDVLALKHEITKVSQTADKEGGYKTAKKWIEPTKYDNFVLGGDELLSNFKVTGNEDGFSEYSLSMGDTYLYVYRYEGDSSCEAPLERSYLFDTENYDDAESFSPVATFVVLTAQMIRRGSVIVKEYEYNPLEEHASSTVTVPFEVYAPLVDVHYDICECTNCGTPYYKADYDANSADAEEPLTCSNCESELDGVVIG
ncbi:MAG: hypothetical protein IJS93_02085 [Clostridia bacterium]|nr:hypothetical protein [Clostridia bacterium]